MDIDGKVCFAVSDQNNVEIDFKLNISPTKIIKKGEKIVLGKKAPRNIWRYEFKFLGEDDYINKLNRLVDQLYAEKDYVNDLICKYEFVNIDIYVSSNFAEMGFVFPNEIIRKIAEIGCTVNFHILSLGMAYNE